MNVQSLAEWLFFFIAYIDAYFLVVQRCQAHFDKKWE